MGYTLAMFAKTALYITHRIHLLYGYLHLVDFLLQMSNVGKKNTIHGYYGLKTTLKYTAL